MTAMHHRVSSRAVRGVLVVAVVVSALAAVGMEPWASPPAASAAIPRQQACGGSICVSQTTDLDPAGQSVQVSGSGFDTYEGRGVYVAFCLVPPAGQRPTPCGGGSGGGGSAWLASDSYGQQNGASPFGPGGSFSVSVYASPTIGSIDCRRVQCAVVTFTDHRNLTDRSQDSIVPVTFAAAPAPSTGGGGTGGSDQGGAAGTGGTGAGAVATGPTPEEIEAERLAPLPAPALTVAADKLSVTDGTRTLRVSRSTDLPDMTTKIRVAGHGYDAAKSIDVALCVAPPHGATPTPCFGLAPATGAAWVAREASADGRVPTDTFGADGTFEVEIDVQPALDQGVDCRVAACAIVTRNDTTRPNDRSQDLAVPVTFLRAKASTAVDDGDDRAGIEIDAEASDSNPWPWIVLGGVALVGAVGAGTWIVRRRRASAVKP